MEIADIKALTLDWNLSFFRLLNEQYMKSSTLGVSWFSIVLFVPSSFPVVRIPKNVNRSSQGWGTRRTSSSHDQPRSLSLQDDLGFLR